MSNIVIAAAKRTAIGSFLGQFNGVPTPTLGAPIAAALEQSGIPASDVSEVLMGCVLPANLGQAPARQAAIAAGIPLSTGATTLNKVCGSGMKTIMLGHDLIKAGSASIVVAGGMESMSNAPHMLPNSRTGNRFGNFQAVDHWPTTAWSTLMTARRWVNSPNAPWTEVPVQPRRAGRLRHRIGQARAGSPGQRRVRR